MASKIVRQIEPLACLASPPGCPFSLSLPPDALGLASAMATISLSLSAWPPYAPGLPARPQPPPGCHFSLSLSPWPPYALGLPAWPLLLLAAILSLSLPPSSEPTCLAAVLSLSLQAASLSDPALWIGPVCRLPVSLSPSLTWICLPVSAPA